MKRFITFIAFQILLTPFALIANENFSVEIEALTLVMEQYKNENENENENEIVTATETESDLKIKKPSYMALKQDECNATVEVTETTGLEVVNTESFDVNVCKKEVYKVIN